MRATVVAGMCAGADCIDDIDVVRSGRLNILFDGVYAPSTVGTLLREFTRHPTAKGRQHLRPSGPPATPAYRPPTSTLAPRTHGFNCGATQSGT